jgi:hypothetical protein
MTEPPSNPRSSDRLVETPRAEPEIILPGEPLRQSRFDPFAETRFDFGRRVYVAKFGTFGFVMVVLAVVAVVALAVVLLVGALLFWIPIVALIAAAAVFSRIWRSRSRH